MRVLIAEDERDTRHFLEIALEQMGHEVFSAENGEMALRLIKEREVQLVIADWLMPDLDGVRLCSFLREEGREGSYVYFILITAKNRSEDLVEAFAAGADDFIVKPFVLEELESRVRVGVRILELEGRLREQNRRLEELARVDPLLEIGNRRSFHETIEKYHDRACRYGQPYGLIMCDLDYFKHYNDTYGHLAGDQVLHRVAAAIKKFSRTSDEVFRYGGEEIIVVLPDQRVDTTRVLAERINRGVAALGIEHTGSSLGLVTISCGVAAFDTDCEGDRWTLAVERADQALYRAKAAGRNRVGI